jgi:hypothetical protein
VVDLRTVDPATDVDLGRGIAVALGTAGRRG